MEEWRHPNVAIALVAIVAIVGIFIYGIEYNDGPVFVGGQENLAGAAAGKSTGNGMLSGYSYKLNIIGMDSAKEVGNSDGHTMFVPLSGRVKIVMTQAPDGQFLVTDRNGLDGSASFNIAPGHYNIYAVPRGKPGGSVHIDATGNFTDAQDGSTLIPLGYVDITRTKKSTGLNINNLFYVDVLLCTAVDSVGTCTEETSYEDYWVFDIPELLEYSWDYQNRETRLLQVRLYPCTLDATGKANDYCRWGDGTPIVSTKTIVAY